MGSSTYPKRVPSVVVAFDPGKATGLSVLSVDTSQEDRRKAGLTVVQTDELEWTDFGHAFRHFAQAAAVAPQGEYLFVAEHFIITPATARKSQAPWSLQVLGMADWILHTELPSATVIRQSVSSVKSFVSNDMLRDVGVWHKGGEGHANDASRHGVYALARCGWKGF